MIGLVILIVAIMLGAGVALPLGARRDGVSWKSRDFWRDGPL